MMGSGETDVVGVHEPFAGVWALALDDQITLKTARMQDQLKENGERVKVGYLVTAAITRSTVAELVVTDSRFERDCLTELSRMADRNSD